MKICYLSFVPKQFTGVKNKIESQLHSFNRLGFNAVGFDLFDFLGGSRLNEKHSKILRINILRKLLEPVVIWCAYFKLAGKFDVIYVRYMRMTPWFLLLIKKLSSSGSRIVLEVPTYPYDNEYRKFSLLSLSDRLLRRYLKKYVSLIVYYGQHTDNIWGIQSVKIDNAAPVETLEPIVADLDSNPEVLKMICVANVSFWHGLDRVIWGLNQLDKDERSRFKLIVVGDGPELNALKKLSNKLNLTNVVEFKGILRGGELSSIFENADVGISSLGLFRLEINEVSPLKPAEYLARGLPVVVTPEDKRFFSLPFVYVADAESPSVDLGSIRRWFSTLNVSRREIRSFALDNLSWDRQLEKVISRLGKIE